MDINIAAESVYRTPLSNSPLLPLLLISLATQKNVPKQATSFKEEYDYIIVGAGSAGSVVASRLSEEHCVSILLLEAGHGAPLLNDVPALGRYFWFTDLDWAYKTVPQKNTGESLVNRQLIFPAGKSIGGSSVLNAMLYVRGNRKDYDNWAAQGAKGWSYEEVLPYFLKMEDFQDPKYLSNGYHASGGPLTVMRPRYTSKIKTALEEAAAELGYSIGDSNGANQTGFDDLHATVRDSQRCSTAKAYLVPAENRTNLDIIGGAHVKKILFEGNRAVGVEFDHKNKTHEIKAKREVILSAGTINSAQLLMMSGVGPKEHLEEFNISVIADLPVGENLQDHCGGIILFTMNSDIPLLYDLFQENKTIFEYINQRSGPLASPENVPAMAFLSSQRYQSDKDFPDYHIYFSEFSTDILEIGIGLTGKTFNTVIGPYKKDPILVCASELLRPKSRGTVKLQSTDPYDPPLIDPNYFDDPSDIDIMVAGLKTCLDIGKSQAMKQVGLKLFKRVFPNCLVNFLNEKLFLECLVRNLIITFSHQTGTCKMGDPQDSTTVVDSQLKVKGIEGLRVVDASVMPTVPSGNTHIPTVMVAEKASDIIKNTIECPAV